MGLRITLSDTAHSLVVDAIGDTAHTAVLFQHQLCGAELAVVVIAHSMAVSAGIMNHQ